MEAESVSRPDVVAAIRGGDPGQAMDGEADLHTASLQQAQYWSRIYGEILGMEEQVMARIKELMSKQSPQARREVELSNVPVVAAQAERFRQRLGFWRARVRQLESSMSTKDGGPSI